MKVLCSIRNRQIEAVSSKTHNGLPVVSFEGSVGSVHSNGFAAWKCNHTNRDYVRGSRNTPNWLHDYSLQGHGNRV